MTERTVDRLYVAGWTVGAVLGLLAAGAGMFGYAGMAVTLAKIGSLAILATLAGSVVFALTSDEES